MREAFCEESVYPANASSQRKKYLICHVSGLLFFALALVLLVMSYRTVSYYIEEYSGLALTLLLVQWFAPIVLSIGAGILCWWLRYKFNVSYDYVFVVDELRISKVFNGKCRKLVQNFKMDFLLKFGYMENDSYDEAVRRYGKADILTPNKFASEGKNFVYLVYSDSLGKGVYVIECGETLLQYLVAIAGRNKLELK